MMKWRASRFDSVYRYDKVGNVRRIDTNNGTVDTQSFTYDRLGRRPTASATGGGANYSDTYVYN